MAHCKDNGLYLRTLATGTELHTLKGHKSKVRQNELPPIQIANEIRVGGSSYAYVIQYSCNLMMVAGPFRGEYSIVANRIAFDVELKKQHDIHFGSLIYYYCRCSVLSFRSVCVSAHLLSGGIVWASDSVVNVSGPAPLDLPTCDMYESLFRCRIGPRRQKRKKKAITFRFVHQIFMCGAILFMVIPHVGLCLAFNTLYPLVHVSNDHINGMQTHSHKTEY